MAARAKSAGVGGLKTTNTVTEANTVRGRARPPRKPPEGDLEDAAVVAEISRLTAEICGHARRLLRTVLTEGEVTELAREAVRIASVPFNAGVAARWGEVHFPDGIPSDFVDDCVRLFEEAGGVYEEMAERRLVAMRPGRLNETRVRRLSPGNPEVERLLDLAAGMVVPLPSGFVSNGGSALTRPRLRKLYLQTHRAVDCKFFEMASAGLAFVLPMEVAERIPGIHFSPAHWAVKQGKECGRPIIDSSDRSASTSVLNHREVAEAAVEIWAAIELPTILQVVDEINTLKASAPSRPWTDLVIWKLDLKGAFTLMSFRASNSKYFAVELVGGLAMIFLCGLFGWTATPAAFNVISRAILYELRVTLGLHAKIYVDDTIAVSWSEDVERDISNAERVMTDLCGDGSVADDKREETKPGRQRIDVLGYCLVLDRQILTLSRRNFFKTFYAFAVVDLTKPVAVRVLERLASLASRYALICVVLRPFCRPLYASYSGLRRNVSVALSPAAAWAVRMWRATLCCTALREALFARSFASFVPGTEDFLIEFDASLEGVGLKVFDLQHARNHEEIVGAGALSLDFCLEGDSSYQNACEFIAALAGTVALFRFCVRTGRPRPRMVSFRGDSVTALTWVGNKNFRGEFSFCAASVFARIMAHLGLEIARVVHLPKELNKDCDDLSRGHSVEDVLGPGVEDWNLGHCDYITRLLELCNPKKFSERCDDFEGFWESASELVFSLSV